jgi:hypothetical protein
MVPDLDLKKASPVSILFVLIADDLKKLFWGAGFQESFLKGMVFEEGHNSAQQMEVGRRRVLGSQD